MIAAIGRDDPDGCSIIPFHAFHLRMEERVVIELVLAANPATMLQNLRAMSVFLGWHMSGFFEQRHVDHAGCIALRTRIAVPVPGAAEISAFLDDAVIRDPGLFQPRTGDKSRRIPRLQTRT